MEMIKDLYDYKGWKIQLRTPDGTYEGVLINVSTEVLKVTLRTVYLLPERKVFLGTQHYYSYEIKSYGVVPGSKEKEKEISKLPIKAAETTFPQYSTNSATEKEVIRDFFNDCYSDDEVEGEEETEIVLPSVEELLDTYTLSLPEHLVDDLPLDHVIIDEINIDFRKAILHIKRQTEIGVAFEGDNIGRFGKLYFVTISTVCCTFLFDVQTLKKAVFKEGLKEILESLDILKVIHDSRQPSDALYHLYGIRLANVFDTQVGDVFGTMQNSKPGKVNPRVHPLHICLMKYLRLTHNDLHPKKAKSADLIDNDWTCRPLSNILMDRAIKNAIYLRMLKLREYEHMMQSFHSAVDVYLNVLRNASLKELELEPSVPHLLPEAILSANLTTFHMKDFGDMAKDAKRWDTFPTFAGPGLKSRCPEVPDTSTHPVETGHARAEKRVKGFLRYANYIAPKEKSSKALTVAEEVKPVEMSEPTFSQMNLGMPRSSGMVRTDNASDIHAWPTTKESIEAVCGKVTVLPDGKLKIDKSKCDLLIRTSPTNEGFSSNNNTSSIDGAKSSLEIKPFVWPKITCERKMDMRKVMPAGMSYHNFRQTRVSAY